MGEQSLFAKQFSRHTRKCDGIGRLWTWLARVQNMNLLLSTDVGISSTDASSWPLRNSSSRRRAFPILTWPLRNLSSRHRAFSNADAGSEDRLVFFHVLC